ncbi:hypothetical protein CCMA1212_000575 [Trichoderma ghanense]|uniref:Uncharacterized protein n=1 Tax=Trichoderma ghanense TaxID=65468 RepID=A0ABY2HKF8_9HYPO
MSPSLLDDGDGSVLATGAAALQQIEKSEPRDKGPKPKPEHKDKVWDWTRAAPAGGCGNPSCIGGGTER